MRQTLDTAAALVTQAPPEVRTGPPAIVSVLSYLGYTLDVWIQVLTIVWLLMLIFGWVWDRAAKRKAKKEAGND